jgi:drug/metabolite transporter (DMT)-like permease
MLWLSLVLIVGANVVYHLAQKNMPGGVHPVATMIVAYAASLLLCLLLLPLWPASGASPLPWRAFNWSAVALGASIVGVELGFLLAYRAGWKISVASLTASITLALILLPVGIYAYHETWSLQRTLGFALCIAGLILLQR